jgi:uncharacterized membrane protein
MNLKRTTIIAAAFVLAFFVLAGAFYPSMPDPMVAHWNTAGEGDGTISRFWGLFLLPIFSLVVTAVLLVVPKIDPLKANIEKFKGYYLGFILVFLAYFLYVYVLTLVWNLGYEFNFTQMIMPAAALFMFVVGIMVGKAKRNYFIGIRTPWTLSSDEVWDRTHRLGGTLFKVAAVLIFLLSFVPEIAVYALIVLAVGMTLFLVVYSYVAFRNLRHPPQAPAN